MPKSRSSPTPTPTETPTETETETETPAPAPDATTPWYPFLLTRTFEADYRLVLLPRPIHQAMRPQDVLGQLPAILDRARLRPKDRHQRGAGEWALLGFSVPGGLTAALQPQPSQPWVALVASGLLEELVEPRSAEGKPLDRDFRGRPIWMRGGWMAPAAALARSLQLHGRAALPDPAEQPPLANLGPTVADVWGQVESRRWRVLASDAAPWPQDRATDAPTRSRRAKDLRVTVPENALAALRKALETPQREFAICWRLEGTVDVRWIQDPEPVVGAAPASPSSNASAAAAAAAYASVQSDADIAHSAELTPPPGTQVPPTLFQRACAPLVWAWCCVTDPVCDAWRKAGQGADKVKRQVKAALSAAPFLPRAAKSRSTHATSPELSPKAAPNLKPAAAAVNEPPGSATAARATTAPGRHGVSQTLDF